MTTETGAPVHARHTVWLLWWNQYLLGVYANEAACREDAQDATGAAATIEGGRGGLIHVSHDTLNTTSHRTMRARAGHLRDRAVADLIEAYGLVDQPPHRSTGEPALLMVHLGTHQGYPGFQFDTDGLMRPGLAIAVNTLRGAGWDDLSIAIWFSTPQGSANGRVPAAVLPHDPMLVVEAAHSSAVA